MAIKKGNKNAQVGQDSVINDKEETLMDVNMEEAAKIIEKNKLRKTEIETELSLRKIHKFLLQRGNSELLRPLNKIEGQEVPELELLRRRFFYYVNNRLIAINSLIRSIVGFNENLSGIISDMDGKISAMEGGERNKDTKREFDGYRNIKFLSEVVKTYCEKTSTDERSGVLLVASTITAFFSEMEKEVISKMTDFESLGNLYDVFYKKNNRSFMKLIDERNRILSLLGLPEETHF